MKTALIVHGSYGHPGENWFPWLKNALEQLGWRVFAPTFPTPENQSLESWMRVWKQYEKYRDQETMFVAHSLGPVFLLHILEKLEKPIASSFFVASAPEPCGIPEFDRVNASFFKDDFDWERIRKNCGEFFVYYSESDPYIPKDFSPRFAKNLGVSPIHIPRAGHFNEKAGYTTFPRLLEDIKTV